MNWILPQEILMETDLTWQATAFVVVGLLNGLALFVWVAAKATAAAANAWRAWKDTKK